MSTPSTVDSATPLARALDQNDAVKEAVKQSADELLVIHAVLDQQIPEGLRTDDIAQALHRTEEMEERIAESAVELAEVNELLEQEIDERAEVERELAKTKEALAKAQAR